MKITLTESEFINRFLAIRPENFSREALKELFHWYEERERDEGVELEFDPIDVCCNWTEYDSYVEAAQAYGWKGYEESRDERADQNEFKANEWLSDQTTVLELSSGCVMLNF